MMIKKLPISWTQQINEQLADVLANGSEDVILSSLMPQSNPKTPDAVIWQPGRAISWMRSILKILCYQRDHHNKPFTIDHLLLKICGGEMAGGAQSLLVLPNIPDQVSWSLRSYYNDLPENKDISEIVQGYHRQTLLLVLMGYTESP